MAKITRVTAQIFGSAVGTSQIAQFGSLAAASPVTYTGAGAITNVNLIQASNWTQGWSAAVEGANSPALEDLNAYCFMTSYQNAYLLQQGVPEWNSTTTYYIGSIAQDGLGNIYSSRTDSNLNNALSSTANWNQIVSNGGLQTYTPTFSVNVGTAASIVINGSYYKSGKIVYVNTSVSWTQSVSPATSATISLPITAATMPGSSLAGTLNSTVQTAGGNAYFQFNQVAGAGTSFTVFGGLIGAYNIVATGSSLANFTAGNNNFQTSLIYLSAT